MSASQVLGAILAAVLQTIGIRTTTEQPRYEIIDHIGSIEVRQYAGKIAAEIVIKGDEERARSEGFSRIAAYIFGGNISGAQVAMTAPVAQVSSGQAIAMTAPVVQQPSDDGWRIQFFMPAKYTLETLPKPKDASVRLVQLPPQKYAVVRFTGSRDPASVAEQLSRLRSAIGNSTWRSDGLAEDWFYDPPWTVPFLRRNEVAIPVVRR